MATIKQTLAFDPRSLSNCALWLDAADTTSLVMTGSSVSQWRDKSGAGNHMNQYSAATAPSTSNLNGINTVYFYTSDPTSVSGTPPFTNVQVLQGTNFQTTVNSTLFLVVYPLYVATSTKFIVNLKSRAANQWNNLYDINLGTGDGTSAGGFGSFIRTDTSYLGVNSSFYTINSTNLTSAEIVGTNVAYYKNASLYRSGTVSLSMPASDNYQVFTLGAYLNTDVYDTASKMGCRAHFCECIVYNGSLTTSQRQQVEGYLAWKWGLTTNLPRTHPFKNGLAPFPYAIVPQKGKKTAFSSPFDPRSISGCQLWLDATDAGTLSLSGSNVTQWRDKSTNLYVASATTSTYTTSKTVSVGANAITIANYAWRTKFTSFIVSKGGLFVIIDARPSVSGLIYIFSGNYSLQVVYSPGGGAIELADSVLAQGTSILDTANLSLLTTGYTNSTNISPYAVNGIVRTSTRTAGSSATDSTITQTLRISGGEIAEIILFNSSLTTAQQQQVEGYLAWKWGIQTKLPSSHPYTLVPQNTFGVTAPFKVVTFKPSVDLITATFSYTGSDQTFTVPLGKRSIQVYLWGAGGGSGGADSSATGGGGAGAMVQGLLQVTPGETLTIVVGAGGLGVGATNVYGGGGKGTNVGAGTAGPGGGRSAIRRSTNDIVTAGGGGGGSWNTTQGGSATFSGTANNGSGTNPGGKGGSQAAGGAAGTGSTYISAATAGSQYQGGNSSGFGGGGGGGYYGGGGASSDIGAGGGGGSSFITNLTLISGASVFGYTSSDSLGAANTSSPYYSGTVGRGGNKTGLGSTNTGVAGDNGLVVIRY